MNIKATAFTETKNLYYNHFLPNKYTGSCTCICMGAQWLSGRVLDSRPRGPGFKPHWRHCVLSLRKNINPSLVLVQPRKTRPFITEELLMGCKESNQTNKHVCTLSIIIWLGYKLHELHFSSQSSGGISLSYR